MNKIDNITTINETIPLTVSANTTFNIVTKDVNTLTHGFHKYPAKFIPQIPRWAISKYLPNNQNKWVIDPFCGSGTTLVEALVSGNNCVGIDVDPLSLLITKVKTTVLEESLLNKIYEWVMKSVTNGVTPTFYPENDNIEHWFTKDAIEKLAKIRTIIDNVPEVFGSSREVLDIRDSLLICFSSIIRLASNADNQSQKTYVSHTKIKVPEEVNRLFFYRLSFFKERLSEFSKLIDKNQRVTLLATSSSDPDKGFNGNVDISLAVTSPPYIKAMDYIYNQMVELFWIGDLFNLQTQSKQNEKKHLYMGNKHMPKSDYSDFVSTENQMDISELDEALKNIQEKDIKNGQKHAYLTHRYFHDMENHFQNIGKFIDSGVHYIMVVGNSVVSNKEINTSEFVTNLAERNGFSLDNQWSYVIKNHFLRFDRNGRGGKIEKDYVIDLVKK